MLRKLLGVVGVSSLLVIPPLTAASAANLPVKAPPPPPPPMWSWAGFYAGANAGWVGQDNSMSNLAIPTPDATLATLAGVSEGLAALSTGSVPVGHKSGFIGGAEIGYNNQIKNQVAGIEADIQGMSASSSAGSITTPAGGSLVVGVPVPSTLTGTTDTRWLGTVRGRLGFLPTPTVLVYGTGGLAYGSVTANTSLSQLGIGNGFIGNGAGAFSDTRSGWTAGGGVEWRLAEKWTAKLEYLHYDLGTRSLTWAASTPLASLQFPGLVYQTDVTSVHYQGDIVRVGLNYKFDRGGPVMARH